MRPVSIRLALQGAPVTRERLLPDIVPLSPTARGTWDVCRRKFLLSHLLGLPGSDDDSDSAKLGLLTHHVLRLVHEKGSCRDDAHVASVIDGYDDSTVRRLRAFVERHVPRCPPDVDRGAHEVEVARFHRAPPPMFMAIARIDAVWIHDGLLDARDYKTGAPFVEEVREDAGARLQAWILARYASTRGLTLRLRYECLAAGVADDPDPFEPDAEDLEAITEEIRTVVEAMWIEERDGDWRGVADAEVCGWCSYRSTCRDSAAVPADPGTDAGD